MVEVEAYHVDYRTMPRSQFQKPDTRVSNKSCIHSYLTHSFSVFCVCNGRVKSHTEAYLARIPNKNAAVLVWLRLAETCSKFCSTRGCLIHIGLKEFAVLLRHSNKLLFCGRNYLKHQNSRDISKFATLSPPK